MPRQRPASPLTVVGLDSHDERLYRTLLRGSGLSRDQLAEVAGMDQADLDVAVERFTRAGLAQEIEGVVTAVPPENAFSGLIAGESDRIRAATERLDALRNLLPSLVSDHLASRHRRGAAVDVHAVEGVDVVDLIQSLAEGTTGDLLWMRPDQWRLPMGRAMDDWVRDAISHNRSSRALYPARVLEEAPASVRARAEAGERVRIVASVPSRVAIFGGSVALLPERWGENTGRLLVVREHALVGALTALFEGMWERALAVPGLDGYAEDAREEGLRRLLLHQLAQGAKDEQIARTLGLSLRTVRRRVADLMGELGADSRFQAGAEAVRRGWI